MTSATTTSARGTGGRRVEGYGLINYLNPAGIAMSMALSNRPWTYH